MVKISKSNNQIYVTVESGIVHYGTGFSLEEITLQEIVKLLYYKVMHIFKRGQ